MFEPKVSVIVPVYNVSKYLEKCLDSIINQTLEEIEIIVVNDCSPDPLDHKICQAYENKDSRIRYIKLKQNKGVAEVRNHGLEIALSKYIGFVDSDDYVHPLTYETTYNKALKEDLDYVMFAYTAVEESDGSLHERYLHPDEFSGDNFLDYLERRGGITPFSCDRLWRRDLFLENGVKFPNIGYGEDENTTFRLSYFANKVGVVNEAYYFYLQRKGSAVRSFSKNHIDSILYWVESYTTFLKEVGELEKYGSICNNRFWEIVRGHLRMGLSAAPHTDKQEILEYLATRLLELGVENIESHLPHRFYRINDSCS